jgi:hypothetical protein
MLNITANPVVVKQLSAQANHTLTRLNQRNRDGYDEVIFSPVLREIDDSRIIDEVMDIIHSLDLEPELLEIENEEVSKFGPRSIAIPWEERRQSLIEYFARDDETISLDSDGPGDQRLRRTSIESAISNLVGSSSSGLPYLVRKNQLSDDQLRATFSEDYPCVLFTRTAEQSKTRNVWGYSVGQTLRESSYHAPFLQIERNLSWRSALLGPDAVDVSISSLLEKRGERSVVCMDFSAYDANLSTDLIRRSFNEIASYFQPGEISNLEVIANDFISVPILTPEGEFSGTHGVPSGSSFTNTVDSFAQKIASGSITADYQIQGDDGVYLVDSDRVSELFSEFATHGLETNDAKTRVYSEDKATYLQRYYSYTYPSRYHAGIYGGIYSLIRAAARLKYLERFVTLETHAISGGDYFSLRALMILENTKHHPGFDKFVAWYAKLDKLGLRFSQEGLRSFIKAQESRLRGGAVFNEENANGISNFEAVKLLKNLS